jgi:hypothetical protein
VTKFPRMRACVSTKLRSAPAAHVILVFARLRTKLCVGAESSREMSANDRWRVRGGAKVSIAAPLGVDHQSCSRAASDLRHLSLAVVLVVEKQQRVDAGQEGFQFGVGFLISALLFVDFGD